MEIFTAAGVTGEAQVRIKTEVFQKEGVKDHCHLKNKRNKDQKVGAFVVLAI